MLLFCSNQSYEKGAPFSNVQGIKFKESSILTQTILQSQIYRIVVKNDIFIFNIEIKFNTIINRGHSTTPK